MTDFIKLQWIFGNVKLNLNTTFLFLVQTGKFDELQILLGGFIDLDLQMHKLMGDSRAEYEEKLKRKLQARQRREQMGEPTQTCFDTCHPAIGLPCKFGMVDRFSSYLSM